MHTYTHTQLTYLLMFVCMFIEKRKGIKAVHKQRREQHETNREAIQIQQSLYTCVCVCMYEQRRQRRRLLHVEFEERKQKLKLNTGNWNSTAAVAVAVVALALCGGKNIEHRNSNSAALCWVHSTVGNKTFCKLKHKQSSRAKTECRAAAVAASVAIAVAVAVVWVLSTFLPAALLGKLEFCYVKRVVGAATVRCCCATVGSDRTCWSILTSFCMFVCVCIFYVSGIRRSFTGACYFLSDDGDGGGWQCYRRVLGHIPYHWPALGSCLPAWLLPYRHKKSIIEAYTHIRAGLALNVW